MDHLKMVCLKKTKGKSATKIEVLEIAIDLLREVHGEDPMDFETAYNRAESNEGDELVMKANQSGTANILRSIRERKRRMREKVLEKELQRLAMYGHDETSKRATSKREILERACTALGHPLGHPVPQSSEENDSLVTSVVISFKTQNKHCLSNDFDPKNAGECVVEQSGEASHKSEGSPL